MVALPEVGRGKRKIISEGGEIREEGKEAEDETLKGLSNFRCSGSRKQVKANFNVAIEEENECWSLEAWI
jgi:hypothetical protein